MGRQRTFDEAEVIVQSASVFLRQGYEGTSIDDLLAATGLHRERAPRDPEVRALAAAALAHLSHDQAADLLGQRLLARAHLAGH